MNKTDLFHCFLKWNIFTSNLNLYMKMMPLLAKFYYKSKQAKDYKTIKDTVSY